MELGKNKGSERTYVTAIKGAVSLLFLKVMIPKIYAFIVDNKKFINTVTNQNYLIFTQLRNH